MALDENFSIINKVKKGAPTPVGVPFLSMKEKILGKKYELSVTFLSPTAQKKINRLYRGKDTTTNILSFPLSKSSGEITFDLARVRDDAKDFDMTYKDFLKYLFIHGSLHLLGFEHGSTMEKEEKKWLKIITHVE